MRGSLPSIEHSGRSQDESSSTNRSDAANPLRGRTYPCNQVRVEPRLNHIGACKDQQSVDRFAELQSSDGRQPIPIQSL